MDSAGETTVMSVLKMRLYSVHKGKKKVQNLDINVLSQIDGCSIIYIDIVHRSYSTMERPNVPSGVKPNGQALK